MNADVPALRVAGTLLLAGAVIFMIGAFSPPWEQWYAPLTRALQIIGEHRVAWYWIHGCFIVGILGTILGFVAFAHGLRADTSVALLAALVGTAYAVGAVFWLVNIAFRCTVQVWAANEVVSTGAIPVGYEAWGRFAGVLFAIYMTLAYLACAGAGWIVLRTDLVARWSGWVAIAFGLTGGGIVGFNIPFIVHVPLAILGVLLMRL